VHYKLALALVSVLVLLQLLLFILTSPANFWRVAPG